MMDLILDQWEKMMRMNKQNNDDTEDDDYESEELTPE